MVTDASDRAQQEVEAADDGLVERLGCADTVTLCMALMPNAMRVVYSAHAATKGYERLLCQALRQLADVIEREG